MNLKDMMGNVKDKMDHFKDDLANIEVEGQAGGGLVKVKMSGDHYVDELIIDERVLKGDATVAIELIKGAFNGAVSQVEEETKQKMMEMSKGIQVPDWMKNAVGGDSE